MVFLRFTLSQWSSTIFLGRLPSWTPGRGPACDNPSYFCIFAWQRQTLYNFKFFAQRRTCFTIEQRKMASKYYGYCVEYEIGFELFCNGSNCDEDLMRLWKAITLKCLEIIMISRTSKWWKMHRHIKCPFKQIGFAWQLTTSTRYLLHHGKITQTTCMKENW